MSEDGSTVTLITIGTLSAGGGAFIGAVLQRFFARGDRILEMRQTWVKEKRQTVFGVGDEQPTGDHPNVPFMRLVPPQGEARHIYDMHTINSAVSQSPDLAVLQPRRSSWAEAWLRAWSFTLVREFRLLHAWWHYRADKGSDSNSDYDKASSDYVRRVRKVQRVLALWGAGQWMFSPSLRMYLSSTRLGDRMRSRPTRVERLAPMDILDGSYPQNCSCGFDALAEDKEQVTG